MGKDLSRTGSEFCFFKEKQGQVKNNFVAINIMLHMLLIELNLLNPLSSLITIRPQSKAQTSEIFIFIHMMGHHSRHNSDSMFQVEERIPVI